MDIENMKLLIERVFDNNEDINPNTNGEITATDFEYAPSGCNAY